ncbi:hypothetical protein POM88_019426 [Heracleum sosnowskyi]|uniref:FBD domain-containing protein n=1 Tax=Heracleum sosnowskyi TaxID=360622 RepID=A0AAD8MQF6_9APIA|nr:hypothetical protein POM88_019426 [Heracleum sosnowskyi]
MAEEMWHYPRASSKAQIRYLERMDEHMVMGFGLGVDLKNYLLQDSEDCTTMDHLEYVTFSYFQGLKTELELVKFVLAHSPLLKTLFIHRYYHIKSGVALKMTEEILQYPRASTRAQIRHLIIKNHGYGVNLVVVSFWLILLCTCGPTQNWSVIMDSLGRIGKPEELPSQIDAGPHATLDTEIFKDSFVSPTRTETGLPIRTESQKRQKDDEEVPDEDPKKDDENVSLSEFFQGKKKKKRQHNREEGERDEPHKRVIKRHGLATPKEYLSRDQRVNRCVVPTRFTFDNTRKHHLFSVEPVSIVSGLALWWLIHIGQPGFKWVIHVGNSIVLNMAEGPFRFTKCLHRCFFGLVSITFFSFSGLVSVTYALSDE